MKCGLAYYQHKIKINLTIKFGEIIPG